jgi:NTE family protein
MGRVVDATMTSVSLAQLFASRGAPLMLKGGDSLVEAGEAARGLYRLDAGRLAAVDQRQDDGAQAQAIYRPGALIGGTELLGDSPFPFTLTALRDSELRFLPRDTLEPLLHDDAILLAELARASLMRMQAPAVAARRRGSILGFVAVCPGVQMRDVVERLAVRMRAMGVSVAVLCAEDDRTTAHLSALEESHDYVLLAAEQDDRDFAAYCGRQIDRLILVAGAQSELPDGPFQFAAAGLQRHRLIDFVLIQPEATRLPSAASRWMRAAPAARLFHVREGVVADLDRLARIYAGRSCAVVLSGGGARAFAHVGALRAMEELGLPVDFVAGTSMGAVIAAGVAMGWGHDELDRRMRHAFVDSSPLRDIAFPLLALTHGREVSRRLKMHFGEAEILDLWTSFMCVSTDLTRGDLFVHRQGLVRDAVRASLSLPGVLPPVVLGDRVLVDGALMRNLPVDLVRSQHDGATVAVDVSVMARLTPEELRLQPSAWRWLTSGAWLRGPPIVAVLIRSATLPAARLTGRLNRADVVIDPDLDHVRLQDWKAYGPAVEAGYRAAMAQAGELEALRG